MIYGFIEYGHTLYENYWESLDLAKYHLELQLGLLPANQHAIILMNEDEYTILTLNQCATIHKSEYKNFIKNRLFVPQPVDWINDGF
jgi:hypothetical protein